MGKKMEKPTSKSEDVNLQKKHILSEEQVVFTDHSEDVIVLQAALLQTLADGIQPFWV